MYFCKCPENNCDDGYIGETIGEYQKELLITVREIKIFILYNIHKIQNRHMFRKQFYYFKQ